MPPKTAKDSKNTKTTKTKKTTKRSKKSDNITDTSDLDIDIDETSEDIDDATNTSSNNDTTMSTDETKLRSTRSTKTTKTTKSIKSIKSVNVVKSPTKSPAKSKSPSKAKKTKKVSTSIVLTEEQVHTNIENLCSILKLPKPTTIFKGKVKPSDTDITRYNLNVVKEHADEYELLECKDKFYFIVIYSSKFNVGHFVGIDWFNHLLNKDIISGIRPAVYVCPALVITDKEYDEIPAHLLKCSYRLVPIQCIHPITGSKQGLDGYCLKYERLETTEKAYNNREWPEMKDSDPGVKLTNALIGELVRCEQLYSDKGNCYSMYKIRRVVKNRCRLGAHPESGLCIAEHLN